MNTKRLLARLQDLNRRIKAGELDHGDSLDRRVRTLAKQWRKRAAAKMKRATKPGPKDRELAFKDMAQAGIYRICAAHLEAALDVPIERAKK